MDTPESTRTALARIASDLDARRAGLMEMWRDAVAADPTLDVTSDWSLRQLNDHFPDVLDAFGRALRTWPRPPASLLGAEQALAASHARTRWLQGYSLRGVMREWGYLNAIVVDQLAACMPATTVGAAAIHRIASGVWCRILNDQQALSALEYHELEKAEAETRSIELQRVLDLLRNESATRGRALESLASDMRNDLQLVMTSQALHKDGAEWHESYALRKLTADGFRGLERSLADMVTLANLEAGLETPQVSRFDAGHGLELLAEGLRHVAENHGVGLHYEGPESLLVEGDAERVRRIAKHLLYCALRAPGADDVRLRWQRDPQAEARWQLLIEHGLAASGATGAPVGRSLAAATEDAHEVSGMVPTGFESALRRGIIPVAPGDGVDLLISKHLCELLGAGLEVEAEQGLVRYRASLPVSYDAAD